MFTLGHGLGPGAGPAQARMFTLGRGLGPGAGPAQARMFTLGRGLGPGAGPAQARMVYTRTRTWTGCGSSAGPHVYTRTRTRTGRGPTCLHLHFVDSSFSGQGPPGMVFLTMPAVLGLGLDQLNQWSKHTWLFAVSIVKS